MVYRESGFDVDLDGEEVATEQASTRLETRTCLQVYRSSLNAGTSDRVFSRWTRHYIVFAWIASVKRIVALSRRMEVVYSADLV